MADIKKNIEDYKFVYSFDEVAQRRIYNDFNDTFFDKFAISVLLTSHFWDILHT